MPLSVPDYISEIKPYIPGKPIEEAERESGIKDFVKLASNENPLGPSPMAVKAISASIMDIHRYPDAGSYRLTRKIAERNSVDPSCVVMGAGSDDVIGMICSAFLKPGDEAIIPKPSFLVYDIRVRTRGAKPVFAPLKNDFWIDLDAVLQKITDRTKLIFITNPHNPTGTFLTRSEFDNFLERLPDNVLVVMDEAYYEFVSPEIAYTTAAKEYVETEKIVSLRTFSKIYGLAGLRIGYGIMGKSTATSLHRIRQPFNVSVPAQAAAIAALDDHEFIKKSLDNVKKEMDFLYNEIEKLGLNYHRSYANFFMIDMAIPANEAFDSFLREGVIIKSMADYDFPTHIRVSAGLRHENEKFISALRKIIKTASNKDS